MDDAQTLEDRFNAITGRLNAVHAELVDLTVEVLRDPNIWGSWECRSVEHFIAWRGGLQLHAARKVVQVARRVDDLPLCVEAFRNGLLSLDQLAPIAKRVPWHADEEICRQAQLMTVEQIQRTASKYPWDLDIPKPDGACDGLQPSTRPEPVDPTEADNGVETDDSAGTDHPTTTEPETRLPDSFGFWWDDTQRLHMYGEFDAATGSIIENALTEARDHLFHNGQADVDWADALREIAERSLDGVTTPARRSRFRVHIHREVDGRVTSATGRAMADEVADYISCDALRSDVFEFDGVPISVGRTQHTVPERTRRTVIARDGGCRVPGCGDARWLDVHHIVHWCRGGPTDTYNLIALCKNHHRAHHRGRLGIVGNADDPNGVSFTNGHGQPIRVSGARPKPPGEPSPTDEPATPYRPALRETLQTRWQHFNLPDGYRPYWDHALQRTVSPRQHLRQA